MKSQTKRTESLPGRRKLSRRASHFAAGSSRRSRRGPRVKSRGWLSLLPSPPTHRFELWLATIWSTTARALSVERISNVSGDCTTLRPSAACASTKTFTASSWIGCFFSFLLLHQKLTSSYFFEDFSFFFVFSLAGRCEKDLDEALVAFFAFLFFLFLLFSPGASTSSGGDVVSSASQDTS